MEFRFARQLCAVLIYLGLLTGCERSASVAPIATEQVNFVTITSNPAQLTIAQTQTMASSIQLNAVPTSGLPNTGSPTIQSEMEVSLTPVEIVVTTTPTSSTDIQSTLISVPTLRVPVSYVLKEYESPYCIARRFNLDIGEFLSTNRLTTESRPPMGTTLYTPGTGHRWSSGDRSLLLHPTSYTVKAGDTLSKVACLYGDVSPEAIIIVNNLQEPYKLTSGQLLQIP